MDAGGVELLAAGLATAAGGAVWLWRLRSRRSAAAEGGARSRAPEPPGPRPIRELLRATSRRLVGQLDATLGRGPRPLDAILGEVEEALVAADVGMRAATLLLDRVRTRLDRRLDIAAIREALRVEMEVMLGVEPPPTPHTRPWVVLVIGVNGVGKTTTVGKLAALHAASGRRVLIVAADTFRAAAVEQLAVWAERTGADVIRHARGASPSAVIFDGMKAAIARGSDVVLVDTAGRLHTRDNLMEELGKARRIIAREVPGAPHEALLVLDATTGQNALSQARAFADAVQVTGVVLTKLDGTARGGVVLAVRQEIGAPVRYLGVGEGMRDLRPFEVHEFVEALIGPGPGPAGGRAPLRLTGVEDGK